MMDKLVAKYDDIRSSNPSYYKMVVFHEVIIKYE
jgi:hypothetical protein